MSSPLLTLDKVVKRFYTDELETTALDNVSFSIYPGEYVSISGPSGCGKSTLLSILGLLDQSSSGSYKLLNNEVIGLNSKQRAHFRNEHIGFIFQSFNLITDMSVAENVELPLLYRGGLSSAARSAMAKKALDSVDMGHRLGHSPAQLSGGQQQRVAIARALVTEPKILLADEPTGNLDSKNAEIVMELLNKLHKNGTTICIVTHDPRAAEQAKRHMKLFDGKVIDDGIGAVRNIDVA